MVELQPPILELRQVVGQVAAVHVSIHSLGDPSRAAGDPPALRDLAGLHLEAASEVRSALAEVRSRSDGVTSGGSWSGAASEAYGAFLDRVQGSVEELASRHVEMANSLEGMAGEAEVLNRDVVEVVAGMEWWLQSAAAAIATLDVSAVAPLVAGARTIVSRWRTLLADLEAFASSLPGRMEIDLSARLPPAPAAVPLPIGGVGGRWPGPGLPGILVNDPPPRGPITVINVPPPRRPNVVINVPMPGGPTTVINVPWPKGPGTVINVPLPKGPSIVTARPSGTSGVPGGGSGRGAPVPPPRDLPAFPDAVRVKPKTPVQGGGGLRRRWKGRDGTIYEWDSQHGRVEAYDRRGRSLGEFDPQTGEQTKGPDPTRKVEP
jgi:uncharacterized protein YukE